ncbi:MAG: zf-HC2 domain-containing protein [Burkholderiales bacterium]
MITCKEASRLISEGLDRDLGVSERARLRVHVAICVACSRVTRQFEFLRRAARAYPGPDDDRPE